MEGTEQQTQTIPTQKPEKSFLRELIEFAIIVIIIVVPFRMYIAQPYIVNGASMEPTFETGDYLIVDQLSYRLGEPERGSILIFKYPKNPSLYFIKRVIGLPGETIDIKEGVVTVKNLSHPDGFTLSEPYLDDQFRKRDSFSITLTKDQYFVLGDNRLGSADSRMWGPVPKEDIVGRPILRLFPIREVGTFPGDERAQLAS